MDRENKRPGLLGGPVERTTHRPRFGASPFLLCSSVQNVTKRVSLSGSLMSSCRQEAARRAARS